PHRLPRHLRTNRRQAAGRPGPATVPALDRDPRRPARLGTATSPRLTLPPTPSRRHRSETVTPLPGMPAQDFRIHTFVRATRGFWEGSGGRTEVEGEAVQYLEAARVGGIPEGQSQQRGTGSGVVLARTHRAGSLRTPPI